MPYCHTVFQLIALDEVESLLSTFTIENFVGGRAAYHIGNGSYSIDAGENDIRAIYEDEVVRFFCRHEKEMLRYEKKLKAFATKHGIRLSTSS